MKKSEGLFLVYFLAVVVASTLVTSCQRRAKDSREWTVRFKKLGTLSSPRLADLTQDGVLDIVMGAGSVEFRKSDSAVIAIDGADGSHLWFAPARDQIFGCPVFQDITGDNTPDVFIGGRSAELMAIDGRDGNVIWRYYSRAVNYDLVDSGAYNFFTPQLIPDLDGDGYKDLIVAAGGFVKALPDDPNRPPGRLLVISSATGRLLASSESPDGKEIYMSVVLSDFKGDEDLSIIFGTGGETVGGSLFKASLADLMNNDLSKAKLLEPGYEKGFIAPPVLADITRDGIHDIIANSVNGRVVAIDGVSDKVIWRVSVPGTEAYCSIAVGYFTEDDVPDFFTNFGVGIWPKLDQSIQLMINGINGNVEFRDTLGTFQESSPLAFDYNSDGVDDAVYSLNYRARSGFSNQLMVIDFRNDTIYGISERYLGANVASTPWIGDLDDDGLADIIYCNEINPFDLLSITVKEGLKISKIRTRIPIVEVPSWGAYMGTYYDGVFRHNTRRSSNQIKNP